MQLTQTKTRVVNVLRVALGAVMVGISLAIVLEGIIQILPPHFSPISQSESDLAVGPYGWLMAFDFVLRGVLYLIFIAAFVQIVPKAEQSRSGLIVLAISAIGKIIIAFAATDLTARPETVHGAIHAVAALGSFLCGAFGLVFIAHSLRHGSTLQRSQHILLNIANVTLAWSVLVIATVAVSDKIGIWGIFERILTLLFSGWIVISAHGMSQSLSQEA